MIAEHSRHGRMILDNVAQQLEERENVKNQDKAGHQQHEIKKKTGEHIGIDHLRQ